MGDHLLQLMCHLAERFVSSFSPRKSPPDTRFATSINRTNGRAFSSATTQDARIARANNGLGFFQQVKLPKIYTYVFAKGIV